MVLVLVRKDWGISAGVGYVVGEWKRTSYGEMVGVVVVVVVEVCEVVSWAVVVVVGVG